MNINIVELLLATGLSLVFLVVVFRPLELAFPAKEGQKFFRPNWLTDLFFLLGQYLLWNGLVFWCLVQSQGFLTGIVPHEFRSAVASQPFWLQVLEVIFLSDFCVYWGHRLQHRSSFLWRFHSVHHSAEHLDWLAAHREHPLDTVYTLTLINLPAFVLGFPLEVLAGFIAFRGVWAIYIHSNVRLPLGRCARCSAPRSFTTGTTPATATPATTATSARSWTCSLAPTSAPTTNRKASVSTRRRRPLGWAT